MASDRYIRWQGYTITQLTFALNLFFGMSVGTLAFAFTLVKDKEFVLLGCPKTLFQIALVSLCLAVLVSCGAVVSRLLDFRFTAKKIRSVETANNEESGVYKYRYRVLGQLTWRLFWMQLATLVIGLVGVITGVLVGYGHRIW